MLREITGLFQLATTGRDMGRLTHEFEMQEDGVRTNADLEAFLRREPQIDVNGLVRYLITSGWAVELATGVSREHGDLDIVVMNKKDSREKDRISGTYGIDVLTAKANWAGMKSSNTFLLSTALTTNTRVDRKGLETLVVHPAIILAQKLGYFQSRLREEDLRDVDTILAYVNGLKNKNGFYDVFSEALNRMPEEALLQVQHWLSAAR